MPTKSKSKAPAASSTRRTGRSSAARPSGSKRKPRCDSGVLTATVTIVPHGYPLDVEWDGAEVGRPLPGPVELGSWCRDFGGDHKVLDLRDELIEHLLKAVDDWRRGK